MTRDSGVGFEGESNFLKAGCGLGLRAIVQAAYRKESVQQHVRDFAFVDFGCNRVADQFAAAT